jgi:hypothetical protein
LARKRGFVRLNSFHMSTVNKAQPASTALPYGKFAIEFSGRAGALLASVLASIACGCASGTNHVATRDEIVTATRRLVTQRERWEAESYINSRQDRDGTWRVEVAEFGEPTHNGEILFVPGSSREVLFSRSGRLISYSGAR